MDVWNYRRSHRTRRVRLSGKFDLFCTAYVTFPGGHGVGHSTRENSCDGKVVLAQRVRIGGGVSSRLSLLWQESTIRALLTTRLVARCC